MSPARVVVLVARPTRASSGDGLITSSSSRSEDSVGEEVWQRGDMARRRWSWMEAWSGAAQP